MSSPGPGPWRPWGFIPAFLVVMVFSQNAYAQIDLTYGETPQELATYLTGGGVQIFNPVLTCSDSAYGTYEISPSIDFPADKGVILSTGNINGILGPNDTEAHTTIWNSPGDADISQIAHQSSFDACALEFDVVPVGDTLRFDFTFASEEYDEYVGTPFNDIFAFFISGPGIVGDPGLGDLQNIALVPNTTVPVGIGTVNFGNPDIGFPPTNAQYFHSNPLGFGSPIQYDGWTQGLFAKKVVQPCDTFRLKLVIADVADGKWDSSVLVEAIQSDNVSLTASTALGLESTIEGCNNGTVTFTRSPVTPDPLEVTFFVQGTATNGLDYVQIGADPDPDVPKTIVIPGDQASATIDIEPLDDGLAEGTEHIDIFIGNPLCSGAIQDSIQVLISDSLEVQIAPSSAVVCAGDSLTFSVIADDSLTYEWSPSTFLNDPNIKEPTTYPETDILYTLEISAGACTSSTSANISVSDLELTASTTDIVCAGAANGAIDLTVSGGQPPYATDWVGPLGFASGQEDLSDLIPGTYTVLVSDAGNCSAGLTVSISEVDVITLNLNSPMFSGGDNVSCFSALDGEAFVQVTGGGTPPFSYAWDDPGNQTGPNATNLGAGTYTVSVTDANGCEVNGQITLTSPDPISAVLEDRIHVACKGETTGSATLSPTGGHGPYNIVWNTVPVQTGPSATGLSAGIYTAEISDVNGCQGTLEVEIEEPTDALSGSVTVVNPVCPGEATGSAVANISGGTGPYTYLWSPDPGLDQAQITGLGAGNYNMTVTDANGCQLSIPFDIVAPAPIDVVVLSEVNPVCGSDSTGLIAVSAAGGSNPYTYTWNTTPASFGPILQNVPAGSYTVTVEDANGCFGDLTVVLSAPDPIVITPEEVIQPECGNAAGSISVSVAGGTAPYEAVWNTNPPVTGLILGDAEEGIHTVTVTDANGCSASMDFEIIAPPPLVITLDTIVNVLCYGTETGSISITVTGGAPGYDIEWFDPDNQTGNTATDLGVGEYEVDVTDANGCVSKAFFTVNGPSSPLGGQIVSITDVACGGGNTGSATVSGTGSTGSYFYQWDDPAGQQTATASGLAPGTYHVLITDQDGCDKPFELEVTVGGSATNLDLSLTPSSYPGGFNVQCANDSSATIDLEIAGGSGPYDILWNLPGSGTSTSEDLVNLAPGTYSVFVSDANGCTAADTLTLTAPEALSITSESTASLCFGAATGSLSIEISGGVPGYTVSWNGPGGYTGSGTDLNNLEGGIYFLEIVDAAGCEYVGAVTVDQPDNLVITVDSLTDFNGYNTSCYNSDDGAIYTTPSGGSSPYSFVWNTAGNPGFSNQEDVENLSPGTYEAVLTDANGCVQSETIDVVGPEAPAVTFELSVYPNGYNTSCYGEADGSIEGQSDPLSGPYTYEWTGPNGYGPVIGNPISGLEAGEYNAVISDENGCEITETVYLTGPEEFNISMVPSIYNGSNISCADGSNGSINLIIDGNAGPYDIAWTGPDGFTSFQEDLFGLEAGEYCVTVSSAAECVQSDCITLTSPAPIDVSILVSNPNCDSQNGSIDASASGGVAPYTYLWVWPDGTTQSGPFIPNIGAGTVCLTVSDANGCAYTHCEEITSTPAPDITLNSLTDIECGQPQTGAIDISVSGSNPVLEYNWTGPNGFSSTTEDISNLEAGIYCISVYTGDDCYTDTCFTVAGTDPVMILGVVSSFEGGYEIDCHGNDNGSIFVSASGGTAPYTYNWVGPNGFTSSTNSLFDLAPGSYCVTAEDAMGCSNTSCYDITEPPSLTVDPDIDLPPCGDGTATVDLNPSGGVAPYTFNWSTGDDTPTVALDEGTFTVLISDANNCTESENITIDIPDAPELEFIVPMLPGGVNIACNGGNTGTIDLEVYHVSGAITYDWTGPDGFTSSAEDLTDLVAGQYCVTAVDAQGCEASGCIELTEPNALELDFNTSNVDCADGNNGSVALSITGGVPTYGASWTGPGGYAASGVNITGLEAGTYCVTVSDLNGCTAMSCTDVVQPDPLTTILDAPLDGVYNIACFGDNSGEISSTTTGGTAPYSYAWTGPNGYASDAENPINLYAGTYCVEITDQQGCSVSECITLTQAPGMDFTLTPTVFGGGYNVSCATACDGSIDAELSGGSPPYDLNWVGPDGFTATDEDLADLCAGTYMLTAVDNNGCSQSASITLTSPEPITISLDSPLFAGGLQVSCHGDSTGTIHADVSGGNGELTYGWSGPNGFVATVKDLENLFAGTYVLTVTDAAGCSAMGSIVLEEPNEILSVTTEVSIFPSGDNISCLGANDGTIDLSPTGGTAPYEYNWNGPGGFTSESMNVSGLGAGDYTLVVLDANGCVTTVLVSLSEPDSAIGAEITAVDLLCAGDSSGQLEVSAFGGSGGLTALWIGPNGFNAGTFAIDSLPSGTYTYLVEDMNGCTLGGAYDLEDPTPIEVSATVTPTGCGTDIGAIGIEITGGTEPYEVLWNTGDTTLELTGLAQGDYIVHVSDFNGCMATDTIAVSIDNDMELSITTMEPMCHGDRNGTISAVEISGVTGTTFFWTGPDGYEAVGNTIVGLGAGTYNVVATAANGCEIGETVELGEPDSLYISQLTSPLYGNGFNVSTFQGNNGIIEEPEITGGTQPYDLYYFADNGYNSSGFGDKGGLEAGLYTVVVLDAHSCEDTARIELTEPMPIEIPNGISPNGDGFNDDFQVRGLEGYPINRLLVFNRWGNKVYEERNYRNSNPWTGTDEKGEPIPEGTYFVIVELEGHDNLRGYLELRR